MSARTWSFVACLAWVAACVPTDHDETLLGAVYVQFVAAPPAERVFVTDDLWSIRVDRVLGTVGMVVDDPTPPVSAAKSCSVAATGRESFAIVDLAQRFVVEQHGHVAHPCLVQPAFVVSPIADLLTRGPGITDEDLRGVRMRTTGDDPTTIPALRYARVVGSATQGTRTLRFDWWIAHHAYNTTDIELPSSAKLVRVPSGAIITIPFHLNTHQIFRVSLQHAAATRFTAFSLLDDNDDGLIDSAELGVYLAGLGEQEVAKYTLSELDLSMQELVGLQLDAAWRPE